MELGCTVDSPVGGPPSASGLRPPAQECSRPNGGLTVSPIRGRAGTCKSPMLGADTAPTLTMEDPARSDLDGAGKLIRLVAADPVSADRSAVPAEDGLVDSYRRLADVYHDLVSEQSLDALLDRIADALAELIPYEALHVYEADEVRRELVPLLVRSEWANEILSERFPYGEGITGWAVEQREPVLANQAHLHPLVRFVPGTPVEPEALIVIPMIARGLLKGTFNIYRIGDDASFGEQEFELAKRFGDAAALALDNAHIRERLEHQAQTDSLTGLFNHRTFHERLRRELTQASVEHTSVAVVMLDIDDFKKVNDVYGHGVGDLVLAELADHLRASVRASDVVCRIGGEEFAVIAPGSEEEQAVALATRLSQRLEEVELDLAGSISVSIGIAHGPEHAANSRELVACAEAAMMTAKARGKSQVVLFDELASERPGEPDVRREDLRSIAHMKLLQSLVGKLNRLNGVREIGIAIANELRLLIDYHNCRIFLRDGDDLHPIAFQGDLTGSGGAALDILAAKVGDGFTGWVAEHGESLLLPDASKCEFAVEIEGTESIEESVIAVPLNLGSRVLGVIVVSKLGIGQLDEDDVRLLDVLAGHAAVALENARLYEAEKREAQSAHALLEFSRELAAAEGLESVYARVVEGSARMLGAPQASLCLQELGSGDLVCCASTGAQPGDEQLPVRRSDDCAPDRADRAVPALAGRLRGLRRPAAGGLRHPRDRSVLRRRALGRDRRRRRTTKPPSAAGSSSCSTDWRIRRSSRSRTQRASSRSSEPFSRRSRHLRTRSRRATTTPPRTRAGSRTTRSGSARSSGSTATR